MSMNIYTTLNEITLYIDSHLEENINYKTLAKMMGVNTYTMQRLFSIITGITLTEYIRKRRLSVATIDLLNGAKVMDVAIKYGYESGTTFSRAFYKFQGVKPSKVSSKTKLINFPRIIFEENINITNTIDYEIIEMNALTLYGLSVEVTNKTIKTRAPKHIRTVEKKYFNELGYVDYGLTTYLDADRFNCHKYYALYEEKRDDFEVVKVPKSKWLKFTIDSRVDKDIQKVINNFYYKFLPSSKFNLRDLPELEHYVDNKTEFLVAIE